MMAKPGGTSEGTTLSQMRREADARHSEGNTSRPPRAQAWARMQLPSLRARGAVKNLAALQAQLKPLGNKFRKLERLGATSAAASSERPLQAEMQEERCCKAGLCEQCVKLHSTRRRTRLLVRGPQSNPPPRQMKRRRLVEVAPWSSTRPPQRTRATPESAEVME